MEGEFVHWAASLSGHRVWTNSSFPTVEGDGAGLTAPSGSFTASYQNFRRMDADRSPTAGLKLAEACQCLSEVPRHECTRERLGKDGTTIHFLAE